VRALPYHRAPDTLRARLRKQLPAEPAPIQAPAPAAAATRPRRRELSRWAMPIAAGLALAVGLNVTLSMRRADEGLSEELVAAQVRSLQAEHLNDVASTDQHTVKPWFAGKLDYSPPVPELDSLGFRLIGGRLDYVRDRPTAVIVYGRRQHVINLFVWPSGDSTAATKVETDRGYNSVHGAGGGIAYWAISDLDVTELRQFVDLAMKSR